MEILRTTFQPASRRRVGHPAVFAPVGVAAVVFTRAGQPGRAGQPADGLLGGGRIGGPVGAASAVLMVGGAVFLTAWVHRI
jgi:hypothetical protein